jgi:hypothetical protein
VSRVIPSASVSEDTAACTAGQMFRGQHSRLEHDTDEFATEFQCDDTNLLIDKQSDDKIEASVVAKTASVVLTTCSNPLVRRGHAREHEALLHHEVETQMLQWAYRCSCEVRLLLCHE